MRNRMMQAIKDRAVQAWKFCKTNPRSSIAGVATLIGSFVPRYATQIAGIATGLGLLMTSDAADVPPHSKVDDPK